jgi:hypothetical protein
MEDLIDRSVGAAQSLSKAALLFLEIDGLLLFFLSVPGARTLTPVLLLMRLWLGQRPELRI